MWEQIPLPAIKSTIRACSVPENGDSLEIWTDDGVFRFRLHPSPILVRSYSLLDAEERFVAESGQFDSYGDQMHGDCGRHGWHTATDLLSVHPLGFTVEIDEKQNRVHLLDPVGSICLTVDSVNVMGRLLITHFNSFYMYKKRWSCFIVCDSASLRVYEYRQPSEGVQAKWSASGSRESQQSLWNAIIEYPDNDTPRLIYADWLEENGDRERAEFIRLQCRIAERESREFIPPDDPDLVLNEQFQNQHGKRWANEFGEIKGISFSNTFWRGFPQCHIENTYLATRKLSLKTILAATPFEFIRLYSFGSDDIRRMEKSDLTSRIRNITIHSVSDYVLPGCNRLFQSPRLNGLRKVSFTGWIGQELDNSLISNGPFPQLHTLEYQILDMDDQLTDFSVLGGAKSLPGLKNVIFFVENSTRQLQDRKDIRKLAAKVENVVQVLHTWGMPSIVTRLHG